MLERLGWYERQKRRARAGFYVSEVVEELVLSDTATWAAMRSPEPPPPGAA